MTARTLQPRRPWDGRAVVLGVTGGIAAYKSVQLARDLTQLGARVDVVMTEAAGRFVQPLSFQAVTGREVYRDLFELSPAPAHISLARVADLVAVAPATANFLAKTAHGLADDLLSTLILATRSPVLLCPAMNDRMYEHPQTQRNLRHLGEVLGYEVAGPGRGPLASGEGEGPGRMLEPAQILEYAGRALCRDPLWEGKEVLVTSGPTREPMDPVRFVGNRSSGRMGFALASAAWRRGASVRVVSGPTSLPLPVGVDVIAVETGSEMAAAVRDHVESADLLLLAAAVGDFHPAEAKTSKVKRPRGGEEIQVSLVPTQDIARETQGHRKPGAVALGFALETEDLLQNARKKMEEKGFHFIVANNPLEEGAGFDVETNRVTLLDTEGGVEEFPLLEKDEVAERLLDRVADLLRSRE